LEIDYNLIYHKTPAVSILISIKKSANSHLIGSSDPKTKPPSLRKTKSPTTHHNLVGRFKKGEPKMTEIMEKIQCVWLVSDIIDKISQSYERRATRKRQEAADKKLEENKEKDQKIKDLEARLAKLEATAKTA
jgi:hypothetical protein